MTAWFLVGAVALLLANAFFVAVEFALIASRRSSLEPMADAGDRRARWALHAVADLNFQLAGSQLGITMASLGLGAVGEPAVAHLVEGAIERFGEVPEAVLHGVSFAIGLSIVVFLHLVVGEMVPKSIAITNPERVLIVLARPNRAYVTVFGPVIHALNVLASGCMRLLGVQPVDDRTTVHTAEELARLLADSRADGLLEETAHDILSGALAMGVSSLGSVMLDTSRVVSIRQDATVADVEALIVAHDVTRVVVLDLDEQPVGFVHAKDLLAVPTVARNRPIPLARIRRLLVLREELGIDEVLVTMRRARTHLAAVVDAEGHWLGLATLEDVLESVVGSTPDSAPG